MGLNGGYGLHPRERPMFGKVFRLDYSQSFVYGILNLVRINHGCPGRTSSCTFSSTGHGYIPW